MKVCIFTLGSRGDVQPYVALGKGLIRAGHEAVICTGGSFRSLVESHGVSFVETSSDLMAIARTPQGKAVLEHPLKNMGKALALSKHVINPAYRKTLDEFYAAARDADCIVYHPKALGAVDIALAYGIPCVSLPPVPITYPIRELPNLAVTTKNLGGWLNLMTYKVNAKAESTQIDIINAFRKQTLHQDSRKAGQYNDHDGTKEIPIIYPISKVLFPEVNSWDGHVFLPGFFFLEEEEERLSGELEDFIQRGPRPIAVTFSSMPMVNPKRFLENLHGALVETGNRAIVLTGNSGMVCENDAYLYAMPALSHQLLFSQVKGVIHHGGVGTMSTALKAGIPQLIIPFSVDQPFWAQRLYQLGIGLKPLREKTATKEALVKAIQQMDAMKQRDAASAIANAVRNENGVQKTVRYLENIYNKKDGL